MNKKIHIARRTATIFLILALVFSNFTTIFAEQPDTDKKTTVSSSKTLKVKAKNATYNVKNGIKGIDVSSYQGTINWKSVASDGVKFAMVRASFGTSVDANFVTNVKNANSNGIYTGAYHYGKYTDTASMKKEAALFLKQLKKVKLTYPVVIDIERTGGLSKTKLTNLTVEFAKILEKEGYKVMIYSYQNFFTGNLDMSKLKKYNLWAANTLEKPKNLTHSIWQYSHTGKVKGINGPVDLNVAYKSLATKSLPKTTASTANNTATTIKSTSNTAAKPAAAQKTTTAAKKPAPAETPPTETLPTYHRVVLKIFREWYDTELTFSSTFTLNDVKGQLAKCLQTEINKQLGGKLDIDGILTDKEVSKLAEITFTQDKTSGRITSLVQSVLYLDGEFLTEVTGNYDSTTVEALTLYQSHNGIPATGTVDLDTWALIADKLS